MDDVRIDILDMRGENGVLVRVTRTASETGFVIESLVVMRTDGDGRAVECVQLDAEELVAYGRTPRIGIATAMRSSNGSTRP